MAAGAQPFRRRGHDRVHRPPRTAGLRPRRIRLATAYDLEDCRERPLRQWCARRPTRSDEFARDRNVAHPPVSGRGSEGPPDGPAREPVSARVHITRMRAETGAHGARNTDGATSTGNGRRCAVATEEGSESRSGHGDTRAHHNADRRATVICRQWNPDHQGRRGDARGGTTGDRHVRLVPARQRGAPGEDHHSSGTRARGRAAETGRHDQPHGDDDQCFASNSGLLRFVAARESRQPVRDLITSDPHAAKFSRRPTVGRGGRRHRRACSGAALFNAGAGDGDHSRAYDDDRRADSECWRGQLTSLWFTGLRVDGFSCE